MAEIHREEAVEETNVTAARGERVEKAGKALATAGLIVLLILGAWGIIVLAFNAPDFFDRYFGRFFTRDNSAATTTPSGTTAPAEALTVTAASTTVASGSPIAISWTLANAEAPRGFLISWDCADGVALAAPVPDGSYRDVACNTKFNYTNADKNMALRLRLTGSAVQSRTLVITISAVSLATGQTTAESTARITILPKSDAPSTSSGQAPKPAVTTKPATGTGYASNPNGQPDLAVKLLSVGYIEQSGAYVPLAPGYPAPLGALRAAQFDIRNIGTKTNAYGWQFAATLPTAIPYTYVSVPQMALTPGAGIVYTLRWSDNGRDGRERLTVIADPYNFVRDANRTNNAITVGI